MSRILTLDLETPDADALFTGLVDIGKETVRPMEGPFVRLIGYAINDLPVRVTTDVSELLTEIDKADVIQGHNILGFDGLALAWNHGMSPSDWRPFWTDFAARAHDTDPLSREHTPPRSRHHGSIDEYDLDHVAQRLGVVGKITGPAGLAALKRKYGGYDRIPVDDPDYVAYLIADVEASRATSRLLPMTEYGRREHRLAALAGHMTLNGFYVNEPLLRQRIKEGQDRKNAALEELRDVYGIPTTKTVARGRGSAKVFTEVPVLSPLATTVGREALIAALATRGAKFYPKTDTGLIQAGREGMVKIKNYYGELPGISRLCDLVTTVTTTRTVYQTALNYLAPDGRVHPRVSMRQASGRWSVTKPGMTVFGKRAGKHVEREIFAADPPTPEVPEWAVITCDLSQVDMRAIAGHCQDRAYMAMFEPGMDAHQELADKFGIKRDDAKPLGHGYNYGLGAKSMIKDGHAPDVVWAFINGMQNEFPDMMAWREEVREIGAAGEILDNGFGRKMRCDPRYAYTVAPALMGQGAARDITCEVVLRLTDRHPEYIPYLRGHAHDEFIFVVPRDQADVIGKEIKDAFTWEWRGVPILADLSPVGSSWGQCSAKG